MPMLLRLLRARARKEQSEALRLPELETVEYVMISEKDLKKQACMYYEQDQTKLS